MKICEQCRARYPDEANYCMTCGRQLVQMERDREPEKRFSEGWNLFFLTLAASLVLSWVFIAVLGLPIFILGAILPLFWFTRKKN